MTEATRQQDERLLAVVYDRARGLTLGQIGAKHKRSTATLTVQTNKVMGADLEHCKRHHDTADLAEIETAYWARKK
ncbi:MAG: hypothetical protein ACRBB0_15310 [Pelagimonas sp.]|uniref:hypothetical protein n=1 Tax=Pelagimonas sp. TaxID=2073170 RepID=UPI003D6C6234